MCLCQSWTTMWVGVEMLCDVVLGIAAALHFALVYDDGNNFCLHMRLNTFFSSYCCDEELKGMSNSSERVSLKTE